MESIVNNLIKAIGWSIFHSLWQGALIYVFLFILLMAVPKLNAKLKHNLAFGSLLFMFLSFCFTFYSLFEIPSQNLQFNEISSYANKSDLQNLSFLSSNPAVETEVWFPYLTGLYILGIGIQLVLLLLGYQKLKVLKRSNLVAIPSEWNTVFQNILRELQ
ncbi:MAG: M56 family metallopeptidase, partial [Bacteroidia bacterium]